MTIFQSHRHHIFRTTLGLLVAMLPLRFEVGAEGGWVLGVATAQAESGPGHDGDGRDDDPGGRDGGDDESGDDRSGDEGGGDEGRDDGRDDDGRDDDGRDDDGRDDGNDDRRGDDSGDTVSTQATDRGDSLHLQYSNGWQEWVRDGRYVLLDPDGQTVSNRAATGEDLARMRAAAGL